MRVVIEADKTDNLHCGLGQFCLHLGGEIAKYAGDLDYAFYLYRENFNLFEKESKCLAIEKIHKILKFTLPKAKVWHATHQDSRNFPIPRADKYLLTIHDLNFMIEHTDRPEKQKRLWKKLQKKINRADALVFISEFTKNEVYENFDVPNIPSYVIHNGVTLEKFDSPARPSFAPEGDFIFSIGTVLPKKNFHVLIDMLNKLPDMKIVIAGPGGNSYADSMVKKIKKLNLQDRFILPGKVSEEEKYWLHKNCTAFAFPSIAEGFGLPVVESMNFGKPLFLSRCTSLPEIGGEDAFYFDNFEADSMAKTFTDGMNAYNADPEIKERLIKRSSLFAWDKAAKEYIRVYKSLM